MGKKVIIISSSFRRKSNSAMLAHAFAEGASEAGNEVEEIFLWEKKLNFCTGCLYCQRTKHCFMKDDGNELADRIGDADVVVFATPIYYYEMAGQMKTLLDRCNPIFAREYRFRDVHLLMSSADDSPSAGDRAVSGLEGWVACFEKARLAGRILAGGVTEEGAAAGHQALEEAREAGRKV